MRRLIKITVNAILAFGWTWTVFAKDSGWVNETQRLRILCGLLALFVAKEIFELIQKPATKAQVAERRDVIEDYLGTVLNRYYLELGLPETAELPAIRVNVALIERLPFFRRRMVIHYTSAAAEGYSAAESQMRFRKGEGVIGTAWKSGQPAFFPSSAGQPLPVDKNKATLVENIQSVLSVPLERKNQVVGVLSFDSEFPIETTMFSQDSIIKFAQGAGAKLAPFCFESGVKRD